MKRSWWICIPLFAAVSASALEIRQVRWGFDGQVVPGRFNLLSVLVADSSGAPFDGALNLYKHRGLEQRVGALYSTPCYLSPLTARWVQFYLYVDKSYDQWRLEWGPGLNDHQDLPAPKWSRPAQVLLSDPATPLAAVSAFKPFPEELFPPTSAATRGLDSLLLDHAPRWEPAKRQAFLDWLRAGGTVHLLLGPDGHYPVFTGELGVLNQPEERCRVGAGWVVRHPADCRTIRPENVAPGEASLSEANPQDPEAPFQVADTFFQALALLSHPRHSWGWIYALAFVYLAVVGPGILLAGRRLADYRLRLLLLVATVAGFAWLFSVAGRRGQGEASVIHTLSYARAIDGDTYEVTQWVNVFATRGAHYSITHAAPHNLYATGQDFEPVNGRIQSGREGRFLVDIPMYSRRAFLHEAEMKGAAIPLTILNWEGTETLKGLTLTAGPGVTKRVLEAWIVQGDRWYAMKTQEDRLELVESSGRELSALLKAASLHPPGFGPRYAAASDDEGVGEEARFRKLVKPLIAWSLGTTKELTDHAGSLRATDGRAQLFLFMRSPDTFGVSEPRFGREIGYVLYHLDLFRPGS
jgi:hypothetical protein